VTREEISRSFVARNDMIGLNSDNVYPFAETALSKNSPAGI
jgi:hypothetical protein